MTEAGEMGSPTPAGDGGDDPAGTLAGLRACGADRFDPVRFRFIEALARRTQAQPAEARRILAEKLGQALRQYGERFRAARGEAEDNLGDALERYPQAAEDLRQLYEAGDFAGLRRLAARLEGEERPSPLARLVAHAAPPCPEGLDPGQAADPGDGAAPELKSLRYFRHTWTRLSVGQQVAQALAQGPENAGPLNSHRLVLQAVETMRDISPDYLDRFLSYIDALLWLDRRVSGSPATQKIPGRDDGERKKKTSRAQPVSGQPRTRLKPRPGGG